jgi:hypothetical protein
MGTTTNARPMQTSHCLKLSGSVSRKRWKSRSSVAKTIAAWGVMMTRGFGLV